MMMTVKVAAISIPQTTPAITAGATPATMEENQ